MNTADVKLYDLVLVVELQLGGKIERKCVPSLTYRFFFCVCQKNKTDKGKNVPFISYRYPSLFEVDPFSASVTQFCFPDMEKFPAVAMPK